MAKPVFELWVKFGAHTQIHNDEIKRIDSGNIIEPLYIKELNFIMPAVLPLSMTIGLPTYNNERGSDDIHFVVNTLL